MGQCFLDAWEGAPGTATSEEGLPAETKAESQICLTNREARATGLYWIPSEHQALLKQQQARVQSGQKCLCTVQLDLGTRHSDFWLELTITRSMRSLDALRLDTFMVAKKKLNVAL